MKSSAWFLVLSMFCGSVRGVILSLSSTYLSEGILSQQWKIKVKCFPKPPPSGIVLFTSMFQHDCGGHILSIARTMTPVSDL